MQELERAVLDEIVDLHGIADLKWAVTHAVAGVEALPVILLPAQQSCLPEASAAISSRFSAFRVLPSRSASLLFVLGTRAALAGHADAVAMARSDAIEPLPLVVACGSAWQPFWRLALQHGHFGITAYGLPTMFNCALDDTDRGVITEFVQAAPVARVAQLAGWSGA